MLTAAHIFFTRLKDDGNFFAKPADIRRHFLCTVIPSKDSLPRILTEVSYIAIFLIPIALHLYVNLLTIKEGLYIDGDWATLSIMTRRAQSFEQLLGNYSRFGWSHPGPALFYMIGALSILFERFATPEMLAVFAYQTFFLFVTYRMLIAYKRFSFALIVIAMMWLLTVVSAVIYPWEHIHDMYFWYWAPVMTVMPMLLLLISAAMVATGLRLALLPLAFATALLPQLHIGTSFHAVVFFLVPVALYLRRYGKKAGLRPLAVCKDHLIWIIGIVCIFALIWCLPLYEALINDGGNLLKVIKFFISGAPDSGSAVSIQDALKYLGIYYALPFKGILWFFGVGQDAFSLVFWCVFIAVNVLILAYAWIRMGSIYRMMVFMVALFIVLSIFSVRNIRGELYQFILYWQYANVAIVYGIVFSSMCHAGAVMANKFRLSGHWKGGRHVAAVAVFLCVCSSLIQMPRITFALQEANREFYGTIKDWIASDEHEVVLIAGDHDTWPHIASVLNAGYRDGLDLCVREEWLFMYGHLSRCRQVPDRELVFLQRMDERKVMPYFLGKSGDILKFETPEYGERYIVRVGFNSFFNDTDLASEIGTKISLINTFSYKEIIPSHILSSCNKDKAKYMNDGNLNTRWDTGRPFKAGDFVTLDFEIPFELAAIKMEYRPSPMDVPDTISLYYEEEDGNWMPLNFKLVKQPGNYLILVNKNNKRCLDRLKIKAMDSSSSYFWSIHELCVYTSLSD